MIDLVLSYRGRHKGREQNLDFFLTYTREMFPDTFRYVVIEQDSESTLPERILEAIDEHHLLHNPTPHFCKGWAFNAAARHFCTSEVVVFSDADMLVEANLQGCIDRCVRNESDFDSPYTKVYFTSAQEAQAIREYRRMPTPKGREKKYVMCGGIFVCRLKAYLDVGGMEEMGKYGWEDSIMDKLVQPSYKCHCEPNTYIHMHHPSTPNLQRMVQDHRNTAKVLFHCQSKRPVPKQLIHQYIQKRKQWPFGEIDKYRATRPPGPSLDQRLAHYHRSMQAGLESEKRLRTTLNKCQKVFLCCSDCRRQDWWSIAQTYARKHKGVLVGSNALCDVWYTNMTRRKRPSQCTVRTILSARNTPYNDSVMIAGAWLHTLHGVGHECKPTVDTIMLLHLWELCPNSIVALHPRGSIPPWPTDVLNTIQNNTNTMGRTVELSTLPLPHS